MYAELTGEALKIIADVVKSFETKLVQAHA
jgi:hypothetical protein